MHGRPKIVYPYNAVLPNRTAHGIYVYQNCASLAAQGLNIRLLCGWGTASRAGLARHYGRDEEEAPAFVRLPMLRRNLLGIRISSNVPFFLACQAYLRWAKPDFVVCSVLKQASFHFSRRIPAARYVYEVHELQWYPGLPARDEALVAWERSILQQADLVTVTTQALKEILTRPPYGLSSAIEVVPLAVHAGPLPARSEVSENPTVMYVGSLAREDNVGFLLEAVARANGVRLEIVGGDSDRIGALRQRCRVLGIQDRVVFHGYCPPGELEPLVARADAFVASLDGVGRMPHVAHTKVLEYVRWSRPTIVPDLPIMREHTRGGRGVLLFQPANADSLARALGELHDAKRRLELQREADRARGAHGWAERAERYAGMLRQLGAG